MAKVMEDNFVEYITDAVMDLQGRESSALPALRKQMEDFGRACAALAHHHGSASTAE